jgi:tetratricopeptide (TPR) repeat protein/O-antigen ligase
MIPGHDRARALLASPAARRLAPILAGLAFLAALLPFGTVHSGPRVAVGFLVELAALFILAAFPGERPSRFGIGVVAACLLGLLLVGSGLLPLSAAGRALLQPGIATALDRALSFTGSSWHPLALSPRDWLLGCVFAVQALLLGAAVLLAARRPEDARRMVVVLVAGGVLVALLAWTHRALGLSQIYGISGIPDPPLLSFFPPFVSANHAAAALATIAPLALALATGSGWSRRFGMVALPILAVASWTTHCRGGPIEMALGLGVFLLLSPSRKVRAGTLLVAAAGIAVVLVGGPARMASVWSDFIEPKIYRTELLANRPAVYADTLTLARGVPWLGVGAGSFHSAFGIAKTALFNRSMSHAHEEFLQSIVEVGAPTALVWFGIVGAIWSRGLSRAHRLPGPQGPLLRGFVGGFTALLAAAAYDFPIRTGALVVMAVVLAAGIVALSSPRDTAPTRRESRLFETSIWSLAALPLAMVFVLATTLGATTSVWGAPSEATAAGNAARSEALARTPQGDLEPAADWYRAAIHQDPTTVAALYQLARVLHEMGRDAESIAALEAEAGVYPTLAASHLELARSRWKAGDHSGAREAFHDLLALDPPDPSTGAAWVKEALSTVEDLDRDLPAILPHRPDRLRDAGLVLYDHGFKDEGESLLREAIAMEPPSVSVDSTLALAGLFARTSRPDQAIALLRDLPSSCSVAVLRGQCNLKLEQWFEALSSFQDALPGCPQNLRAIRVGIGVARMKLDDPRGLEVLRGLLREDPTDVEVRRQLLTYYRARRQTDEVLSLLDGLVVQGKAAPPELREYVELEAAAQGAAHPQ